MYPNCTKRDIKSVSSLHYHVNKEHKEGQNSVLTESTEQHPSNPEPMDIIITAPRPLHTDQIIEVMETSQTSCVSAASPEV